MNIRKTVGRSRFLPKWGVNVLQTSKSWTTYFDLLSITCVLVSISTFNQNSLFVVGELRLLIPIILLIIVRTFVNVSRPSRVFGLHKHIISGLCFIICTVSCTVPSVIPQDSMSDLIVPSRVSVSDWYITFIKIRNGSLHIGTHGSLNIGTHRRRVSRGVISNCTTGYLHEILDLMDQVGVRRHIPVQPKTNKIP